MPCGPDAGRHAAGIREFEAAGFTHVALVQIGADTQERFIPSSGRTSARSSCCMTRAFAYPSRACPKYISSQIASSLWVSASSPPRYGKISLSPVNRR